jgi:hypothetical protein
MRRITPRILFCVLALLLSTRGIADMQQTDPADTHPEENSWAAYVAGLAALGGKFRGQLADPADAALVQELYRHMYMIVSQGYGGLVYQDAEYPDFWPQFSTMYNYAIINTDDTYYTTPLNPKGVYKVTGYRGTALMVDLQVGSEHFFYSGLGKLGPPLNNYDFDTDVKQVDKNGYFELIFSAERPAGYDGNWLYLDPKATHLFVRQIFYDYEKEVTGRYSIERLDVPAARPRDSADKMAAQLKNISTITHNWVQFALDHTKNLKQRGVVNQMAVRDFSNAGGVSTQIYMDGLFDISNDEALILELRVPDKCYYWGFVVYDELWQAIDWLNRQGALNGHQARIDDNWLDAGGYQRGGVFGRFNRCPGKLEPTMQKVRFSDIRKYLPENTPVVSAEARDAALRARRRAIQLRQRW